MKLNLTLKNLWTTVRSRVRRQGHPPRIRVMRLMAERALEPVFQPMVDLRSGVLLGHEALIRAPAAWRSVVLMHCSKPPRPSVAKRILNWPAWKWPCSNGTPRAAKTPCL